MILLALFTLALVGTTVTLLARASALPRVRAARRLDQIAAYGAAGTSLGGVDDVPIHCGARGTRQPARRDRRAPGRRRARMTCAAT